MLIRSRSALSCVVALAIGGFAGSVCAGEKVTLVKPGSEQVAPPEADPFRLRNKAVNELRRPSFQPSVDMPYIPPEVRVEPRKTVRKNIFGDPINPFANPGEEGEDNDKEAEKEKAPGFGRRTSDGKSFLLPLPEAVKKQNQNRDQEQDRALSPVQQFDWNPEDGGKSKSGDRDNQPAWVRRDKDDAEPGFFNSLGFRKDSEKEAGANRMFGVLTRGKDDQESKDDFTRQELERRNDFQAMMNPAFSPLGRNGAAEGLLPPPEAAPLMPATALMPRPDRSLDPMQAFRNSQQSWRGPSVEDLNRRSFGSVAVPPPAASQPRPSATPKPSLMRQPTVLDVPSRAF